MAHEQAGQDHQWKRSAGDHSRQWREGADRGRAQGIRRTDLRSPRRGSEARHPAPDARVENPQPEHRQTRLPAAHRQLASIALTRWQLPTHWQHRESERLILHTISRGAAFAFRLSPMIKIEMCELQCLAIGVRSPLLVPTRGTTTWFAACSGESLRRAWEP